MAKVNLSGASIKHFFLYNGEKLGLGVAVLLLVLFAYSAWGRPSVPSNQEPEAISQQATSAIQHITTSEPEKTVVAPPPQFDEVVELGTVEITLAAAKLDNVPDPLPFDEFAKRPDPKLFPVEDLQVGFIRGAIALEDRRRGRGMGAGGMMPARAGGPGVMPAGPGPMPLAGPMGPGATAGPTAGGATGRPRRGRDRGTGPLEMVNPLGIGPLGVPGAGTGGAEEGVTPLNNAQLAGVSAAGAKAEGRYIAVVTGAVPTSKQQQEYLRAFQDAMRPDGHGLDQDQPIYGLFVIERSEVTADGDGPWKTLDFKAAVMDEAKWATQVVDVVDVDYTHQYMTRPLPPLFGKDWTYKLAGHKKIPANPELSRRRRNGAMPGIPGMPGQPGGGLFDTQPQLGADEDQEGFDEEMPEEEEEITAEEMGLDEGSIFGDGQGGGMGPGGMPGMGPGVRPGMGPGAGPGVGRPRMDGRRPAGGIGAGLMGPGMNDRENKIISHLLLRFFDFTVQPGKQYRYRVKVQIANPNYRVKEQYLEDPSSQTVRARETDWSEPSPVVTVPPDHHLLAVGGEQPRSHIADPKAKVGIVSWIPKLKDIGPAEAAKEFEMGPGDVATFQEETEVIDYTRPALVKAEKFRFAPNSMLVDIRGGKRSPSDKSPMPTEMLFLDLDGNLVVHRSVDEAEEFSKAKKQLTVEAPAASGMLGPGTIGPGMPGPSPFGPVPPGPGGPTGGRRGRAGGATMPMPGAMPGPAGPSRTRRNRG